MRADLPKCNLKTCRLYSDGNCVSKEHYDKCEYILAKKAIVQHAHWDFIQECSDGSEEYRCSNCKHYLVLYHMASPYCPHCGARMDEEVEP